MEFVLKWYYSVPDLDKRIEIQDFLNSFRSVVREERERMLEEEWETSVSHRSSMMESKMLKRGFDVEGISKMLEATHSGAFTSCLRLGRSGRYVLDILSSSRTEDGTPLKLGLISNAGDGDAIRQFLKRNDLERYFGTMIISEEIGLAKPWKRIFHMALDELDVRPERSVYIGDRYQVDVVGSREAGMLPVYIRQYHTAGEPPEGIDVDAPTIENLLDLIPLLENGDLIG
jgi:FMN phosphatase YigB (HAD superfamily)